MPDSSLTCALACCSSPVVLGIRPQCSMGALAMGPDIVMGCWLGYISDSGDDAQLLRGAGRDWWALRRGEVRRCERRCWGCARPWGPFEEPALGRRVLASYSIDPEARCDQSGPARGTHSPYAAGASPRHALGAAVASAPSRARRHVWETAWPLMHLLWRPTVESLT